MTLLCANQCCGSGSGWIRIILGSWIRIKSGKLGSDPNQIEKLDPDPHQSEKLDQDQL